MQCCTSQISGVHLKLARSFRYFGAAGGCIWEVKDGVVDSSAVQKIIQGIEEMNSERDGAMFHFVFLLLLFTIFYILHFKIMVEGWKSFRLLGKASNQL